jgi:hypothetical protein
VSVLVKQSRWIGVGIKVLIDDASRAGGQSVAKGFGPLPRGDRQDTLQQLSLKALRNALPAELFLLRDERVDDKGIDMSLEAKVGGAFTNCRSQVQLKSTDDGPERLNRDRSYSLSVTTANLNYMLNGPSPLYIIWFYPTNELRYAWASDVCEAIAESNPDWMEQESVTIRFVSVLSPEHLREIHDRILREAKMQRELRRDLQVHSTMVRARQLLQSTFNAPEQAVRAPLRAMEHELKSSDTQRPHLSWMRYNETSAFLVFVDDDMLGTLSILSEILLKHNLWIRAGMGSVLSATAGVVLLVDGATEDLSQNLHDSLRLASYPGIHATPTAQIKYDLRIIAVNKRRTLHDIAASCKRSDINISWFGFRTAPGSLSLSADVDRYVYFKAAVDASSDFMPSRFCADLGSLDKSARITLQQRHFELF